MRKGEIPTEALKITPQAMTGVKNFILVVEDLEKELNEMTPSDFIESLVKKIHYRDHLVKEE
jgi:FAD synthase